MFPNISKIIGSASSYFYLPIDDDEEIGGGRGERDDATDPGTKHISWESSASSDCSTQDSDDFDISSWPSSSSTVIPNDTSDDSPSSSLTQAGSTARPSPLPPPRRDSSVIEEVLAEDDLYKVLGIKRSSKVDRLTLRRAYLTRSKACHPDKFPDNPEATQAFQKVSVAYDVLSAPGSKRMYDAQPRPPYDFAAHPYQHRDPEETFRGVVLGAFNDFLDGDLETVRTLLRAINDLNPSLTLGDDAIDSVLMTLESIRQRALTCRTCVLTLNAELSRLIEVQYAFRQLGYFDFKRRSKLSIELTRIAIGLPVALDRALQRQNQELLREHGSRDGDQNNRAGASSSGGGIGDEGDENVSGQETTEGGRSKTQKPSTALLNKRVYTLLCGFTVVLERMESFLS